MNFLKKLEYFCFEVKKGFYFIRYMGPWHTLNEVLQGPLSSPLTSYSQISDVEHLNNTTQSKLNVMKERVTDLEADNIRLRGHIKSVERQNEELEQVLTFSSDCNLSRDFP